MTASRLNKRMLASLAAVAAALLVLVAMRLGKKDEPRPKGSTPAPSPVVAPVPEPATSATSSAPAAPSVPVARPPSTPHSRTAGSEQAAELNAPGFDAAHDVATLHVLLRQYLRLLHHRQGLPIGDDIDLARALTGHNPMNLVFLPASHPALTADGHLRDRWGTPYFIHPRGNNAFEVRSAGPDRKLFTADDISTDQAPDDGTQ